MANIVAMATIFLFNVQYTSAYVSSLHESMMSFFHQTFIKVQHRLYPTFCKFSPKCCCGNIFTLHFSFLIYSLQKSLDVCLQKQSDCFCMVKTKCLIKHSFQQKERNIDIFGHVVVAHAVHMWRCIKRLIFKRKMF